MRISAPAAALAATLAAAGCAETPEGRLLAGNLIGAAAGAALGAVLAAPEDRAAAAAEGAVIGAALGADAASLTPAQTLPQSGPR